VYPTEVGDVRSASLPRYITLGEGDRGNLGVWVDLRAGMNALERREMSCFGRKLNP